MSKLLRYLFYLFVLSLVVRSIWSIVSGSQAYLFFVTDDFYYYFLPAKNLVSHGFSSFDGITETNGYHPLWFGIVSLLWAISASEKISFVLLTTVAGISSVITFENLRRIVGCLFPKNNGAFLAVYPASAVLATIIFLGMETTVLLPFLTYLILYVIRRLKVVEEPLQPVILGLLSACVILSRLDYTLFVALLLIILLVSRRVKITAQFSLRFAIGICPVLLYFAFNLFHYGYLLPVSAMVKSLHSGLQFNMNSLHILLFDRDGMFALWLAAIALISLFIDRRSTKRQQSFKYLLLAFPFLYFSLVLTNSTWVVNRWYFAPLPVTFIIAVGVLSEQEITRFACQHVAVHRLLSGMVSVLLLGMTIMVIRKDIIQWKPEPNSVYSHAVQLLPFVESHPGVYAMGDRAGLTAEIWRVPMLQLEGLNSDYSMMNDIRTRASLLSVLRRHNVDYLVESSEGGGLPRTQGSYSIEEPHAGQAGESSPKMTANIFDAPIAMYQAEHGGTITYIFKMR